MTRWRETRCTADVSVTRSNSVRWRPDRDPASCTFDQLDVPLNYDLYDVLES